MHYSLRTPNFLQSAWRTTVTRSSHRVEGGPPTSGPTGPRYTTYSLQWSPPGGFLLSFTFVTIMSAVKITHYKIHGRSMQVSLLGLLTTLCTSDVRFPTSLTGDGTDAMYVLQSLKMVAILTRSTGTRNATTHLRMSACLPTLPINLWDMEWHSLLGEEMTLYL